MPRYSPCHLGLFLLIVPQVGLIRFIFGYNKSRSGYIYLGIVYDLCQYPARLKWSHGQMVDYTLEFDGIFNA